MHVSKRAFDLLRSFACKASKPEVCPVCGGKVWAGLDFAGGHEHLYINTDADDCDRSDACEAFTLEEKAVVREMGTMRAELTAQLVGMPFASAEQRAVFAEATRALRVLARGKN